MTHRYTLLKLIGIAVLILSAAWGVPALISAQKAEMPTIIDEVKWHPRGEGLLITGRASPGTWGLWLFNTDMQFERFFSTENPISADWSPDGTRLSIGRNILDAHTLEVLLTIKANSGIGGWSPDGALVLAWADPQHLGLFDSRTGDLARRVRVGETTPDAVSWSPNGAYFALVQPTGTTDILSAEDGRQITSFSMEYPIGLRWSVDSRYLAAAFTTIVEPGTPNTLPDAASPTVASVVVWEALTGSVIQTFSGLPALPLRLRWNPQKPELAGGAGDGLSFIWNVETGQQVNIFRTISELTSLDYSPFGGRLAVGAWAERQSWYDARSYSMATQTAWARDVVPDTLGLIIPEASIELLQSIEAACVPVGIAETIPDVDNTTLDLSTYTRAVNQNAQIPPGCRADLLAVAEVLQAEQP